jgi:hypothetical protein
MPASVRMTNLTIVNEVQQRLGINPTNTLSATRHSIMLTQLLNEVIAEINDYGRWQDLYEEVIVTAATSVRQYTIAASAREVQSIIEVSFNDDPSQLENRPLEDIRRLRRVGGTGTPRQYAIIGVDASANPIMEVHPQPGSSQNGQTFNIAIQAKEPLYTTSDVSAVPSYPGNLLVMGLYAKALLEENGGEPTRQFQTAYQEYQNMARQSQRRFTSDTEDCLTFTPHRFG